MLDDELLAVDMDSHKPMRVCLHCRACLPYPVSTCQAAKDAWAGMTSGVVTLTISGNNYATWCEVSGTDVWTLIMKTDGSKQTFTFDSSYWSNQATYNDAAVSGGLDAQEYKSALYWLYPFTQVRLGMKGPRTGGNIYYQTFGYTASSLYSQIADGGNICCYWHRASIS
jgi:hypothetical protein